MSAISRTNQWPAAAALMIGVLLTAGPPDRRRTAVFGSVVFVAIVMLPLAHNLLYGGQWVLTTTSADIPENLVLPPGRLAGVFTDAGVSRALADQLRAILFLGPDDGRGVRLVFRALQLLWLGALLLTWRAPRGATGWIVTVLPWLYLLPHVFYQVTVYYPRHIVIGHLAFGLSAAWLTANARRRSGARPVPGR
jgi:hypothetical protein